MAELLTDDSPIIFNDSITADDIEDSVADVAEEIETVEIEDDSTEVAAAQPKKSATKSDLHTILPLSRVKKILKLDPDVNLVTSDAVKLVTYCTVSIVHWWL